MGEIIKKENDYINITTTTETKVVLTKEDLDKRKSALEQDLVKVNGMLDMLK